MRLWIDECLSPTLVGVAQRRHEATCNAHRGLLNAKDAPLYEVISQEEWAVVTDDDDFLALTRLRVLRGDARLPAAYVSA